MRVCAYARVSTDKEDQLNSLANQKSYFEREIPARGHDFAGLYYDEGLTGTQLDNRAGFDEMLKDAGLDIITIMPEGRDRRKNKQVTVYEVSDRLPSFDEIWIKNTSRFARNILSYDIITKLRQKGVSIYFLEQNINTKDIAQDFLLQLFQVFDQNDSRDKSLKVKSGISEGIKRGVIHSNSKIYGYKYIAAENRLERIPHEAVIVRKIHYMYDRGLGIRRIMNELTKQGIYTRQGRPFCKSTITRILTNEKYAGFNNRGKYDTGVVFAKYTTPKVRDDYQVTKSDRIPQIISPQLFYRNKERREGKINHVNQRGAYKGVSEYAGLIYCGHCGEVYYSNRDRRRDFYNCKQKKTYGLQACNNPNVSKTKLDQEIAKFIKELPRLEAETLQELINKKEQEIYGMIALLDVDNTQEIEETKQKINQLKNEYANLIELYAKGHDKDTIDKALAAKKEKIDLAKTKLAELTRSNAEIIEQVQNAKVALEGYRKIQVKDEYTKEEGLTKIKKITATPDKRLLFDLGLEFTSGRMLIYKNPITPPPIELTEERKQQLDAKYKRCLEALGNVP